MSQKYINNNGELERIPGTEIDPLTLGEKTLLEPELKIMSTELNLNQPTLPGMKNLPVTKPNKKPIHQQLTDLKHWAQPETDPTAGAYYVPKEQRIYESLKVPGYETPEKSNVSYKKLKQKEKGTYPFDTPQ